MKELNKRLYQKLPENRAHSSIREYEQRRRDELSKRKRVMDDFAKKIKDNVISKSIISGSSKSQIYN